MPISGIGAALNMTIGKTPVSMIRFLTPKYLLTLLFFCSFTMPTTAQYRDEDRLFADAEKYYTHGQEVQDRFEKAKYSQHVVGLYENFLAQFPNSRHAPLARFHLGHALQTLGQLDQAKVNYRAVINRHLKGKWVGNAARQLAYPLTFKMPVDDVPVVGFSLIELAEGLQGVAEMKAGEGGVPGVGKLGEEFFVEPNSAL